jgi:hypothetical protein
VPASAIRVFISAPQILLGILSDALGREPGIEIVGELIDGDGLLAHAVDRRADVILDATYEERDLAEYDVVLCAKPTVKVVSVAGDGRTATVLELVIRRTALGELGLHDLGNLIRRLGAQVSGATSGDMSQRQGGFSFNVLGD